MSFFQSTHFKTALLVWSPILLGILALVAIWLSFHFQVQQEKASYEVKYQQEVKEFEQCQENTLQSLVKTYPQYSYDAYYLINTPEFKARERAISDAYSTAGCSLAPVHYSAPCKQLFWMCVD